jgi:hypothetical protein
LLNIPLTVKLTKTPLILSFGRSGSMLLTHNIGRSMGASPVTVSAGRDNDFLKTYKLTSPIQSHGSHTADDISNFTCLFNFRKDPVNTILSIMLATHFDVYHVWKNQSVELTPFRFDDWSIIDTYCQRYINWCGHYSTMLNSTQWIVYYEDYVAHLPDETIYQQTFPSKSNLITNYHEVQDRVLNFKDRMLTAQAPFAKLPIYKFESSASIALDKKNTP